MIDKSVRIVFLCLVLAWVLYGLFGYRLIETVYNSAVIDIVDKIMPGRSVTPLEDYFLAADSKMLTITLRGLAVLLVLTFLFKKPFTVLYTCFSFFFASFLLFCAVELLPPLGEILPLDNINYYHSKRLFVDDDILMYKQKPFVRTTVNHVGRFPPSRYGIDVQAKSVNWVTDEDGFRNSGATGFHDIVVIGDGFVVEGSNEADTFGKRLERRLPGLKVGSFGTGGYGPFQYLEVLKRYAIKRKPKYALLAFDEGNDLLDIPTYLRWEKSRDQSLSAVHPVESRPLLRRYIEVLGEAASRIREEVWNFAYAGIRSVRAPQGSVHEEVAVVRIGNNASYKILFIDRLMTKSTEEILQTDDWHQLKNILVEFRNTCAQNEIVPILLFIPSAAHIYAEYSTKDSGRNWLRIQEEQIAAKANLEKAILDLSRDLQLELINLTPPFQSAAQNGKVLYHSLSTHWNSEGMEVAAEAVATRLKSKFAALFTRGRQNQPIHQPSG
jgi:hypothetical protein